MILKAQLGLDIMYINNPSNNKDFGNLAYIDNGLNYSEDVKNVRGFLTNWLTKRKETGEYNDQLLDLDFMLNRVKNTPIKITSNYTDSGGKFVSTGRESLGGITLLSNPSSSDFNAPSYARNLHSNIAHELSHAASLYQASTKKYYENFLDANEAIRSLVTAPILKVQSIVGGNLVPMGGTYEDTAAEVYARLMQMREAAKMNPNEKYKYNDYKAFLKKYGLDFGKEKSEALMNDVALIDNLIDNGVYMGKNGIKIFGL